MATMRPSKQPGAGRAQAAERAPAGAGGSASADLASVISGGSVAWVGRLADVTVEQFEEAVESQGGRVVPADSGESLDVLVVGGGALPLTSQGDPAVPAVRSSATLVLSEDQFLSALSLAAEAESPTRLFTLAALAQILREPPTKIRAWYKSGLITPSLVQHGIPRFEFRQVAAARTLAELTAAGVSIAKLRQSLDRLRKWLPDVRQPLEQLDVLERSGALLVRLEAGELAEIDGQLQMEYDDPQEPGGPPVQLRLVDGPSAPGHWHEQGVDQERHGLLTEAEASYRRALFDGGPDAQICFDLAHVLQAQGKLHQAAERYRQALELDPRRLDAWNNLGVVLGELGQTEEACTAFRSALRIDAQSAMSHYNMADTLEAMGMPQAARDHWQAYLKLEPGATIWSKHARQRLGAK